MKASRRRLTPLLFLVLLLATAACQRAGWPVAAGGGYLAGAAPAPGRTETERPAATPGPTPLSNLPGAPANAPCRLLSAGRHQPLRHASVPHGLVHARASPPAARTAHRRLPRRRRAPALGDDAKFNLVFFGGSVLAAAAGLALVLGVGGGLAVASGLVLILGAVLLALFGLYAKSVGHYFGG